MAASDYQDKRFLIIDDLKSSRDLLKQFVFNLDPEVVEASGYVNDVVFRCSENYYDVILLGYNLGDSQKNGQQLLEELRTNGLINRQSVVILITAENSQAMVLAALEHKPDDYLTKPYRLKDLFERLDRCYKKKRHMKSIYQALDSNDSEQAIVLCDQAIDNRSPYRIECFGIKSRQLFEQEELDAAKAIYQRFEVEKNCQWAAIGLGKIALKEQNIDNAIGYFSGVIEKYPLYLSSYDWLATSYETIDQRLKAQEVLERALIISPLSVKRLERYAQLCFENGDYEKATNAFERNYQLSCHSIHHKPENAFNFSESLNYLSPDLSDYQLKIKKNRVVNALKETAKSFNTLEVRLQTQLHSVRLLHKTHEEYDAKRLLQASEGLLTKVSDELGSSTLVNLSKLLIDVDQKALASTLMSKAITRSSEDIELMAEIDKIVDVDSNMSIDEQHTIQGALNDATKCYRQHDYDQAIQGLLSALETYPAHIGIKLNLIQVLLTIYERHKTDKAKISKAQELLASLVGLPSNHRAYVRYQLLENKCNALK